MKILEVANVDFSLRHFVLPLMHGLRARGHEVVGCCADGPLLQDVREAGFRVEPVPMARSVSPAAQLVAFRAVLALIRSERPEVVHAHMPISGFLARAAARVAGVPCIAYTCHGFLFNQPGPLFRRGAGLAMEWIGGRLTDLTMTVSAEEAADARRLHIAAAPQAIGNGRSPTRYRPDPEARHRIRTGFGIGDDRVVVIAVSRLVRHKGHPELLAAMESVDAELWVVGERLASDHGEDLGPVLAAAQDRLGPRLRRLGSRTDIPALLAAADVFALPSHFEGLPMSVIEAMLCGLPVVSTAIRGPREQVIDNVTGFLVPPRSVPLLADALQRLTRDAALRHRLGAAGRERAVSLYDEATIVDRTVALLEQCAPALVRRQAP